MLFAKKKTNAQNSCAVIAIVCFRDIDSTISLLPKFPKFQAVAVRPDLCRTWLETPNTDFLMPWLKCGFIIFDALLGTVTGFQ